MKIPTNVQLSYTTYNVAAGSNAPSYNLPFPGNFFEYLGSKSGNPLLVQTTGGFSFKIYPGRWYQLDNPTDSWTISGFDAVNGDFLEFNLGLAKSGAPVLAGLQTNMLGPIVRTVGKGSGSTVLPVAIPVPLGAKVATFLILGFAGANTTQISGSVFGANTFAASSLLQSYDLEGNAVGLPSNFPAGAAKVNVTGLSTLYFLVNSINIGLISVQFDTNGAVSPING